MIRKMEIAKAAGIPEMYKVTITTRLARPSLIPGTPKLIGIRNSIYENIKARAINNP